MSGTRLSPSTDIDESGVWSPDGLRIAWVSQRRNLMMRGAGSLAMLALFLLFAPSPSLLAAEPADQMVRAHILFNVLVLIGGIPLSGAVLSLVKKIVKARLKEMK